MVVISASASWEVSIRECWTVMGTSHATLTA
jgi:hypothetical protein